MYEYDDAGRIVRTVSTPEPRYTDLDRGELLALALHRASLCPCGCGFLAEDTFSHEEIGPAFSANHQACRATLALIEQQRASVSNEKSSVNHRARVWRVSMRRR